LFGVLALVIAVAGIGSMLALWVRQRMREIGIRIALGASPGDILGTVVRQGMVLALIGAAAGLAGSLMLSRLIAKLLFEVTPSDAPTYVVVSVLLLGSAFVACWIPARRASRIDPQLALFDIRTMDERTQLSLSSRRTSMTLAMAFAGLALFLSATGIYGVLSGSVAERIREIGVRAALGASPSSIVSLVLRQGMVLTLVGVAIGLTAATGASRALVTMLFGVSRLDPVTYGGVVALLFGVSAVACSVPAWRAARVDPSMTLRAD
jgi:ABC-type antimicrobial peptide transport system permease subunit